MQVSINKQVAYTIATGCVVFMFPEVPLKGLELIGQFIGGSFAGFFPPLWEAMKSWAVEPVKDMMNSFNMAPSGFLLIP